MDGGEFRVGHLQLALVELDRRDSALRPRQGVELLLEASKLLHSLTSEVDQGVQLFLAAIHLRLLLLRWSAFWRHFHFFQVSLTLWHFHYNLFQDLGRFASPFSHARTVRVGTVRTVVSLGLKAGLPCPFHSTESPEVGLLLGVGSVLELFVPEAGLPHTHTYTHAVGGFSKPSTPEVQSGIEGPMFGPGRGPG
uniref:(northern house mosquito) hypothetical protein n=1 Tax=Culex pipiens TaxID=7175 RepID=A0A8D8FZM4_CULPI